MKGRQTEGRESRRDRGGTLSQTAFSAKMSLRLPSSECHDTTAELLCLLQFCDLSALFILHPTRSLSSCLCYFLSYVCVKHRYIQLSFKPFIFRQRFMYSTQSADFFAGRNFFFMFRNVLKQVLKCVCVFICIFFLSASRHRTDLGVVQALICKRLMRQSVME